MVHFAEKSSPYLESIWAANFFVTMHTNAKKFPLLGWLQYFSVPPAAIGNYVRAIGANNKAFMKRIDDRGNTQHPDHFDQLLAPEAPIPSKKDLESLETICLHLLLAGYEPISSSFHGIIALILQDPPSYQSLVKEIRSSFGSYEEITADSLVPLKFLHATVMEQLRIIVVGATGQPRVSPGAAVDGHFIPKGVSRFLFLSWFLHMIANAEFRWKCSTEIMPSRATRGGFTTPTASAPNAGCLGTMQTGMRPTRTMPGTNSTRGAWESEAAPA